MSYGGVSVSLVGMWTVLTTIRVLCSTEHHQVEATVRPLDPRAEDMEEEQEDMAHPHQPVVDTALHLQLEDTVDHR